MNICPRMEKSTQGNLNICLSDLCIDFQHKCLGGIHNHLWKDKNSLDIQQKYTKFNHLGFDIDMEGIIDNNLF